VPFFSTAFVGERGIPLTRIGSHHIACRHGSPANGQSARSVTWDQKCKRLPKKACACVSARGCLYPSSPITDSLTCSAARNPKSARQMPSSTFDHFVFRSSAGTDE